MPASFLKKLAGFTGVLVVLWLAYLYRLVPHTRMPFARVASAIQKISLQQGPQKVELNKQGGNWVLVLAGNMARPADENRGEEDARHPE